MRRFNFLLFYHSASASRLRHDKVSCLLLSNGITTKTSRFQSSNVATILSRATVNGLSTTNSAGKPDGGERAADGFSGRSTPTSGEPTSALSLGWIEYGPTRSKRRPFAPKGMGVRTYQLPARRPSGRYERLDDEGCLRLEQSSMKDDDRRVKWRMGSSCAPSSVATGPVSSSSREARYTDLRRQTALSADVLVRHKQGAWRRCEVRSGNDHFASQHRGAVRSSVLGP